MIKGNQGIAVAACILISIPYIKLMKNRSSYSSESKYWCEIMPYER
jgi:hypothetical protein